MPHNLAEWVGLLSGVIGIGIPLGTLIKWTYDRRIRRRAIRHRLRVIREAAESGEIVICIGIGGPSKPQADVLKYIAAKLPAIKEVLVYQAPATVNPADPEVALRIAEDLRSWIRELGESRITRIHFFPAGMASYPFLLGALLSNIGPVLVYQHQSGTYVPLYQWDTDMKNRPQRATQPLAEMRALPTQTVTGAAAIQGEEREIEASQPLSRKAGE